ncbi:MAG: kinase/pyrophosphorylase [Firmicutes bacterium]|nr:kinase/pyrophosphorylase [Candidatus Fermentithermobacillaceae bacterium]HOV65782.1 pyruvate, water dikinase regulatory protein [Bacillota bacterium]HRC53250.1 pyruvate, water dikinase regulatory protein [Bacillota bacterium]
MEDVGKPKVFVLSDSLGDTAEAVVRAAAAQFNGGGVDIYKYGRAQTKESIDRVLENASRGNGVVVHTLVKPEMREYATQRAAELGVLAVDVLGPVMEAIGTISQTDPRLEPGLMHRLDDAYFRRVEAIEFAVNADDGKNLSSLPLADVVLIGVSRTSKTPVSLYLAQRGYKVANVPLVPELSPPPELMQIPRDKIVGLTLSPEKLAKVRKQRLKTMGLKEDSPYADPSRILAELEYADKVFRDIGCSIIDVTDKAIEETALNVTEIIERRNRRRG